MTSLATERQRSRSLRDCAFRRAILPTVPDRVVLVLSLSAPNRTLSAEEIGHRVFVSSSGAKIITAALVDTRVSAAREALSGEQPIVGCPPVFSFLAAPATTALAIAEFAGLISGGSASVEVDLSSVQTVDLCAGSALMALAREAQGTGTQVMFRLPLNDEILERLIICGLSHVQATNAPLPTNALVPARRLVRDRTWTPKERALAITAHLSGLGEHVSTWLRRAGHAEISPIVLWRVRQIVTEIGVNILGHTDDGWWLCAALCGEREQSPVFQVVAFNLGTSIYDTMQRVPNTSLTLKELAFLRQEHESRGNFDQYFTPDDLVLLYALQDFVTSFGVESRRGAGTFRIAHEFAAMAGKNRAENARMALVSGTTRVLFDDRYGPAPSKLPGRERRMDLSFNLSHDLRDRPDREVFHSLGTRFPGTLFVLELQVPSEVLLLPGKEAI